MKTLFTLLFLIAITIASSAQEKPKPDLQPKKPVYQKYLKTNDQTAGVSLQALQNWRRLLPYDPTLTAEQIVQAEKEVDGIIQVFPRLFVLDSVRVDTVAVAPPPVKKKK